MQENKKIKVNLYLKDIIINISVTIYDFFGESEEIKFSLKDISIENEDLLYKA